MRDQPGVRGVVLAGAPPKGGVGLVAAVTRDSGLDASVASKHGQCRSWVISRRAIMT